MDLLHRKAQSYKFSNKNGLFCAWRDFNKTFCGIPTYHKWMFKLQISSIFNFDWAHQSWISGILSVNTNISISPKCNILKGTQSSVKSGIAFCFSHLHNTSIGQYGSDSIGISHESTIHILEHLTKHLQLDCYLNLKFRWMP